MGWDSERNSSQIGVTDASDHKNSKSKQPLKSAVDWTRARARTLRFSRQRRQWTQLKYVYANERTQEKLAGIVHANGKGEVIGVFCTTTDLYTGSCLIRNDFDSIVGTLEWVQPR